MGLRLGSQDFLGQEHTEKRLRGCSRGRVVGPLDGREKGQEAEAGEAPQDISTSHPTAGASVFSVLLPKSPTKHLLPRNNSASINETWELGSSGGRGLWPLTIRMPDLTKAQRVSPSLRGRELVF